MNDRRQRKKETTRKALLDAAIALMAERGLYATRIEDITERADLGKGAFYNYFLSKDALVAALAKAGLNALPVYVKSLKDPVSAAMLEGLMAEAPPAVVVNTTGFAVTAPGTGSGSIWSTAGR